MRTFTTTATTKKGNFRVTINLEKGDYIHSFIPSATINIDGHELPVNYDQRYTDRIYASIEVCKCFGVTYNTKIALACDLKEVKAYIDAEIEKGVDKKISEINRINATERMRNF